MFLALTRGGVIRREKYISPEQNISFCRHARRPIPLPPPPRPLTPPPLRARPLRAAARRPCVPSRPRPPPARRRRRPRN